MFLVNGQKATLIQYNRSDDNNVFDDQDQRTITIKCCPYNISQGVGFGIYTVEDAAGYYQVPRQVDVREGDQIIFLGKGSTGETHTILDVQDNWYFNRIENKIIAVK